MGRYMKSNLRRDMCSPANRCLKSQGSHSPVNSRLSCLMSISLVYLRCCDYGYLQSSQEGQGPCLFGIFRSITVVYGLRAAREHCCQEAQKQHCLRQVRLGILLVAFRALLPSPGMSRRSKIVSMAKACAYGIGGIFFSFVEGSAPAPGQIHDLKKTF